MINVTDKFKQAMKEPVKMVTASLVLDDNTVITGQDKLIKITIDSSGHLFGTATSVVNVELFGTNYNLVDHTFSVIAKTLVDIENDTWEEANLGLFYIDESTADFEKKTTKIKGYDLMGKLAKTPYNSGTIQFPCTVKELINQLAERFEFTVDTNLDNLPNITYQIPEDLYAKISNCTYRDILGEIAGATATIAVFNSKTLSFRDSKKKPDEDEIWTYDNLKTLKYKPKYGPVNSLVLARTPQEDNIAISDNDSITANGLTEVKLANNEILDDDRRKLITPIFDSVKDFSHYPFEAETTGLGWYKPGDIVSAQAGGGLMNGRVIGWLGQKTITGKNLIDYSTQGITKWQCTVESYGNGVKIITKEFSGVAYVAKAISNSARFLGKTITVSAKTSGSVIKCAIYLLKGNWAQELLANLPAKGGTYKLPDNLPADRDSFGILFYVRQNSTSTVTDVQVELGDVATEYEPYIGGYNNLFDEFSDLPFSTNGVTLSHQNGVLKLTGKPTADWVPLISRDITNSLKDKRTYTVFQPNTHGGKLYSEVIARRKDGGTPMAWSSQNAKTFTFTVDFDTYSSYIMKLQMGPKASYPEPITFYNNYALFAGNYTADNLPEYSPYNTPLVSPRPQLPQVINEIDNSNILVTNKNLFFPTQKTNSGEFYSNVEEDGSITFGGKIRYWWGDNLAVQSDVSFVPNKRMVFSIDKPLPFDLALAIFSKKGRIISQEPRIHKGQTSIVFTLRDYIVRAYPFISINNTSFNQNTAIPDTNIKVQVEYGNVATSYIKHESSSVVLPSLNIYKLTDTTYDEVKLENGVAKLIKRVGKLVLTGEENITHYHTSSAGTIGFKYRNPSGEMIFTQQNSKADIICSHFDAINEDAVFTARENKTGVSIYGGYNNFPKYSITMGFWFTKADQVQMKITDVSSFKNWLKAEKAKGTPVTIYYEMRDYQTTELGRTNLNQVYVTDTHLELGNGIKETIKGVAPTATQTDYARAGGITKTIYNTEIKVDKQKQEIESIVSKQTDTDQKINEEFSKVAQNIKNIITTIQTTGGGNIIKNSVGYAKNQDGSLVEWSKNNLGAIRSYTSPESKSYGAISGNTIELSKSAIITQRLNVASSGNIPYTLSFRCKKSALGTAIIKLSNTIDTFTITIPEGQDIIWKQYELTKLDPSMNYLDLSIAASADCTSFMITDLMFNMGDQVVPWVQASGEILNTQVAVNDRGMKVSSSVYQGDYVEITPLGMSGHSSVSGVDEEVFKLNRDVTETSKLSARKEIFMNPIRIVPVQDGDMAGWSFVDSGGNNA